MEKQGLTLGLACKNMQIKYSGATAPGFHRLPASSPMMQLTRNDAIASVLIHIVVCIVEQTGGHVRALAYTMLNEGEVKPIAEVE